MAEGYNFKIRETEKLNISFQNIPLNDILYFESNKRVLIVHTKNDEYSF